MTQLVDIYYFKLLIYNVIYKYNLYIKYAFFGHIECFDFFLIDNLMNFFSFIS